MKRNSIVIVLAVAVFAALMGAALIPPMGIDDHTFPIAPMLDQPADAAADPQADTDTGTGNGTVRARVELPGGQGEPADPSAAERASGQRGNCGWEYLGESLTGNRGDDLPVETLQVVLFYDGEASTDVTLTIDLGASNIVVGGQAPGGPITIFGEQIETREYRVFGCEPSGRFSVDGVVPNGVIDGLAFGVLFKDADGRYTMYKSNDQGDRAEFVGMWPLGMNDGVFAERTPQVEGFGRESARAIIWGAALVDNGTHHIR